MHESALGPLWGLAARNQTLHNLARARNEPREVGDVAAIGPGKCIAHFFTPRSSRLLAIMSGLVKWQHARSKTFANMDFACDTGRTPHAHGANLNL